MEEQVSFRHPTASPRDLLRPVAGIIQKMECNSEVVGASVSLAEIEGESGEQLHLFDSKAEKRRRLEMIAGTAKSSGAPACLKRALLADTRSPLGEGRFSIVSLDEAGPSIETGRAKGR